jgi:hypothetical protein
MSAEPFLAPGPDAPQPAGDGDDAWFLDEEWERAAYFGSLMTAAGEGEELTVQDVSGSGFGQDGTADQLRPGPLLATLVHAATSNQQVLAGLPDDDLIGIIRAARKLESLIAWAQLTAIREFATRPGAQPAGRRTSAAPCPDPEVREFAADELTGPLAMTWQGAAGEIGYARTVAGRLPLCFAALAAGKMHPRQLRIIAEETAFLSDADVAIADEILAGLAPGKTPGQLRARARRLVLRLDPDSARRRRDAARSHAELRKFAERSGNAGMVAHELPADEALASWQHIEQRALDLRAAGVPGNLQDLRVRAYLDLTQERDSRTAAAPVPSLGQDQDSAADHYPGNPAGSKSSDSRNSSSRVDQAGSGSGTPDTGPSLAALITITVPLGTVQGTSEEPGHADGFGPLDAETARDLLAAAARHPRTRWCITSVAPDGTATAHACAPGARHGPPDPKDLSYSNVIRGPCHHAQAQRTYRPSRKLRHLVNARNTTCTAPGCSQPAARCDLDHTDPWEQGGPTCACNLAPLCRHHHRCKQAQGWRLEQPEPGILTWHTPTGRTYTLTPTRYTL